MADIYASTQEYEARIRGLLENTDVIQSILTLSIEERRSLSDRIESGAADALMGLTGQRRNAAEAMELLRPLKETYNIIMNLPQNAELASLSFSPEKIDQYVDLSLAAFAETKAERNWFTMATQYVFAAASVLFNPSEWGNFGTAFGENVRAQETKRMAVGMRETLIDADVGAPIANLISGIDHNDKFTGAGPAAMADTSGLDLDMVERKGAYNWKQVVASTTAGGVIATGAGTLAWKATPLGGTISKTRAIYGLRSARAELSTLTDIASRGATELGDDAARLASMGDVADMGRDATQTAVRIAELNERIADLEARTGGRIGSSVLARTTVGGLDAAMATARAARGAKIGGKAFRFVPVVGTVGGIALGASLATYVWNEGNKAIDELKTAGLITGQEEWLRDRLANYAALENDPLVVFSIAGQKAIYEEVSSQLGPQVAQRMFPGTWFVEQELSYAPKNYKQRDLTNGAIYAALSSESNLLSGRLEHPVSQMLLEDADGSRVALQALYTGMQRTRSEYDGRTYTTRDGETLTMRTRSEEINDWENKVFRGGYLDGPEIQSPYMRYSQLRRDLAGNGVIYQQLLAVAGTPQEAEALRIELYQMLVGLNTDMRSGAVDSHEIFYLSDEMTERYPLVEKALRASRRVENGALKAPSDSQVASFNDARDTMKYVSDMMEVTTAVHFPLVFTPAFEKIMDGTSLSATDFDHLTFQETEAMLAFLHGACGDNAPNDISDAARDFLNVFEEYQKNKGLGGLGNNRNALEGAYSVFSDYSGYAGDNFTRGDFSATDIVDTERYREFLPVYYGRSFVIIPGAMDDISAAQKFDLPTFIEFLQTTEGRSAYEEIVTSVAPDAASLMGINADGPLNSEDNLFLYFSERPSYLYQTITMAEYIAIGGEAGAMGNSRLTSEELRAMAADLIRIRDTAMEGRNTIKLRGDLSEKDMQFLYAAWGFAQELEQMKPELVPSLEFERQDAQAAIVAAATDAAMQAQPIGFSGATISMSEKDLPTLRAFGVREADAANTNRRPASTITGTEEVAVVYHT